MGLWSSVTLLAAPFDDWGTLVFIVIAMLVGLVNWFKKLNQPAPPQRGVPPRRPRPAAGDRLSSEIEIFLQEVAGKKPARDAEPEEVPIEIVSTEKRRQSSTRPQRRPQGGSSSKKRPRPATRARVPKPAAVTPRSRPGENIAGRTELEARKLDSKVEEHLSEYMQAGRLAERTEERIGHQVGDRVAEHLGTFGGAEPDWLQTVVTGESSSPAQRIVKLLRDPVGIRQAILINEILSPPKTRR